MVEVYELGEPGVEVQDCLGMDQMFNSSHLCHGWELWQG